MAQCLPMLYLPIFIFPFFFILDILSNRKLSNKSPSAKWLEQRRAVLTAKLKTTLKVKQSAALEITKQCTA